MKYILILTILFSFSYSFSQQHKVIDQVLAIVGNNMILESDIENQFLQLSQKGYVSSDLKCDILEELLYQKLLLDQAEKDSLEITAAQLEKELDRRFRFFIEQIGSVEQMEEYFGKSLLEMKADLRSEIKEQLLTQQMQEKLTSEIKITPSEVRDFFKALPKDSLPYVNTEIELLQIELKPKVSEMEKLRIKNLLTDFKERIKNGDAFSMLAALYSEDPGSASKGGALGFVGRGDLVPEFSAVAFNLKKGEISKIVETEFGFHIIQLIEKKGELCNFSHILIKPKANPIAGKNSLAKLDSIRDMILKDSISFSEAALLYSDDKDSRANGGLMINPYYGTSKFTIDQINPNINYEISNLAVGDISKPFEAVDGSGNKVYKIIAIKSKTKPHQANLQEDYNLIQDMALEDKKNKVLEQWIQKKQESTYVKIDSSYLSCSFGNKWTK